MSTPFSRRHFVRSSWALTSPVFMPILPQVGPSSAPLRIVSVGGHPDDPESGCAGTLARYSAAGHQVAVVYLTRGERGIRGKSDDEAGSIRTRECEAACKVMGARAVFAGQLDGSTELSRTRVEQMQKLLESENPDVVFTHWPTDTHMDHQVASICTMRACWAFKKHPRLFFFEVNTGAQSLGFLPNVYVDITETLEKKKAALVAHQSQNGEAIWRDYHEVIANWRGREAGVKAAEAFFELRRDRGLSSLPGL